MGSGACWWSITEESEKFGIYNFKVGRMFSTDFELGLVHRSTAPKKYGFSVRCLKG